MCDQCQTMHSERNPPTVAPCESCKVDCLPENIDAHKIFRIVKNQLIVGMSGAIAVNQNAVHEAMRLYKVKNKKGCFEKVLVLSNWWIKRLCEKCE